MALLSRSFLSVCLAALIAGCPALAAAQAPLANAPGNAPATTASKAPALPRISHVIRGKDVHLLARPQRDDPRFTDVVVFFWYGSPWSAQVEPYLREWVEQGRAPANVRITFVPVVLDPNWAFSARIFYALEKMGAQRHITPLLLRAAARNQVNLASPSSVSGWLAAQGVDAKAFARAINDPLVIARVSGLLPLARQYEVRSTPTFVIDGRYRVSPHAQMPPERAAAVAMFIADQLGKQASQP